MKRFTLAILMLCFTITMAAEPVGKQTALYTAQNYMLAKGKTIQSAQPTFKSSRKGAAPSTDEEAYYYVFNAGNDGGYVIVSGDDRTEPILGYVDHGSFDPENIPDNMRSWLQGYADEIKYIIDNNIKTGDPRIRKRNKVAGTKHAVPELLSTRWNQSRPYNILCPMYYKQEDGTRDYPATGCTATAMAQVIAFYKFPDKTKAIIPAHSNTYTYTENGVQKSATVTAPAIPRNTVIDWENMRDTYNWPNGHVSNAQDSAVAKLMLLCGQSVKMGWGPSSGANFDAEVFIKIFGYDTSAYKANRSDYSIDDWFDMCYKDISEGYPICFAGFASGGGHAFVLDGFDGDNLFHVNWGWGGGSNGWFLVGILNPGDTSGIGASSSSDGYSMGQYAVFNLRLPDNNNADTYLYMKDVAVTNNTSIKTTFENRSTISGSFNTAIVKLDDDGGLSVVGSQQSISSMASGSSQTKTFNLKNKLPEGTYKLSPANKAARNTEWRTKYNLRDHYIEAVVDSTGALTLTPVNISSGNSISIDTIVFPGTRIAGKQQEVKVTFRNDGDEYNREIHFFASKTNQKVYTNTRSIVAVRSGETVDVSYYFTPAETGTYNLWFCTESNGNGEVGRGTMEVITEAQASKANLTVSSYNATNAVNGVLYGNALVGKATIKNNRNVEFHGRIRFQLWNQPSGSNVAWSGPSTTHEIDIAANKSVSVDFSFDGLSENNKYYIATSYVDQDGSPTNGGIWDLGGWDMKAGIAQWKTDGTLTGKAYGTSISILSNICGIYADCSKKINRMPTNNNPNTIYAFSANMELPINLDTARVANVISGSHANHIFLNSDNPYFVPVNFVADSASFTYTFPEEETGTGWHTIMMPFEADSIFIDDTEVSLENSTNHFWIYEFAAQGDDGEVIFTPATVLRGNTPYIIAGDKEMAGRSIVFRSLNVPLYKMITGKGAVTSPDYKFHANTFAPKVKDCYVLNNEGTAFEYVTTTKALPAQAPYFTTDLPEELRLESIVLPEVPVREDLHLAINDETESLSIEEMKEGYTVDFTHNFNGQWEAIYLPFSLDYEAIRNDFDLAEIDGIFQDDNDNDGVPDIIVLTTMGFNGQQTTPNMPYLIRAKQAGEQTITLENTCLYPTAINAISCSSTQIDYQFQGWYNTPDDDAPGLGECYVVKGGALLRGESSLAPCRWYMTATARSGEISLPSQIRIMDVGETITGISSIGEKTEPTYIYNIAGQRLSKMQRGFNLMNGKVVLKR